MYIQNREELVSHGDCEGRAIALNILEAGLAASDPYVNTLKLIRINEDKLLVGGYPTRDVSGFGDEVIDLSEVRNIYVIGSGKAVQRQAKAIEDLLGDRLTAGAINIKRGEAIELQRIAVTEAAHPVPDECSVDGTEKMVEIAQRAKKNDLVFTIFSSGSSSLSPLPAPGITLKDLQTLYQLAIKYGSQRIIIEPMFYLSQISGGRIMKMIQPAHSINLIMAVGLYPRWHGILPQTPSFIPSWPPGIRRMKESVLYFKRQPWYDELPTSIRGVFNRLDPNYDLPDITEFQHMTFSFWQPIDFRDMINGACAKANELGIKGVVLSSRLSAISSHAANVLSQIAHECELYGRPFTPPVALITGGHLNVPIGNTTGIGGRNQEFVLTWAQKLGEGRNKSKRVVVAALDSDGTDGPGTRLKTGQYMCMAGGVIDGNTMSQATALNIDVASELANHNSTKVLIKLKSAINTGNTGTCLGDLRVAIIR